jgi:hypothetical protein
VSTVHRARVQRADVTDVGAGFLTREATPAGREARHVGSLPDRDLSYPTCVTVKLDSPTPPKIVPKWYWPGAEGMPVSNPL